MSYDVFISYSRADSERVRAIVQRLEKLGIRVWFDRGQLRPGSPDWRFEIEKALEQASAILYIASPNSYKSPNVREELAIAESLPMKRFVAMIEHTRLPYGYNRAQRANLHTERRQLEYRELLEEIVNHTHTARRLIRTRVSDEFSPPPRDERDTHPLSFEDTLVMIRILEAAADLIPAGESKGRAALLWVDPDCEELYVVGATNHFEENELRWRLKYAQGFAGEVWAKRFEKPIFDYPALMPTTYMKRQWGFTNEQIAMTRANKLIVSVPIYRPRGEIAGILQLDSRDEIPQQVIDTPLFAGQTQKIANYLLNKVEYAKPISYRNYKNLSSIIHTIRLFSPMHVKVRSAIFLVDQVRQDLFMLVGSEDFAKVWVSDLRFKKTQGLIGAVWRTGAHQEDQRDMYTAESLPVYLQDRWNMTEKQVGIALKTKSILGVPIWSDARKTSVIGVLMVDSPQPAEVSKISRTTQGFLINMHYMAHVASKIIQYDRSLGVYL